MHTLRLNYMNGMQSNLQKQTKKYFKKGVRAQCAVIGSHFEGLQTFFKVIEH